MTYKILIGQRLYSSWSLRGWLPFAVHAIPVEVHETLLYNADFGADLAAFGADRTVPAVKTPDGGMLTDSLAIGWHLTDTFPDRGLLPEAGKSRALAQSMIADMHGGFAALRGTCPMNLATAWDGFVPPAEVITDLARVDAMWARALDLSGGPFLFGDYGLADAFYAPVCIRIAGYALSVSAAAQAYVRAQLSHTAIRQWRDDGLRADRELPQYDMKMHRRPFPMPA